MKVRILTTVVVVFIFAGMLKTFFYTPLAKADHCHPTPNTSSVTTPTQTTTSNAPNTNIERQRNSTRVLSINNKPVKTVVSSFNNRSVGSDTLSIEDIYSKEFPMAISSINQAVKALKSGDRQTELVELNKALDKLTKVYRALETHVKPQFANSLICPIMGSPIEISMVDKSLTREYKGRKIAFCCSECPSAWDKLSDVEKQTKVPGVKS